MIPTNELKLIYDKLLEKAIYLIPEKNKSIYTISIELQNSLNLSELVGFFCSNKKFYFHSQKLKKEFLGLEKSVVISGKYQHYTSILDEVEILRKDFSGNIYSANSFSKFDESKDSSWNLFHEIEFFVPALEFVKNKNKITVHLNLSNTHIKSKVDLEAYLKQLIKGIPTTNDSIPKCFSERYNPEKLQWNENITKAIKNISLNLFKKVVLSRKSKLKFNSNVDPLALMYNMKKSEPNCSIVFYQVELPTVFLSITPESLFYKKNNTIYADTLAGTIEVGNTKEETAELARNLQKSEKNITEHNEVLNYIKKKFETFSDDINILDKLSIMKLSKVQHLKSTIKMENSNNISDLEILKQLHPTPAVGGVPKKEALEFINSIEEFNRGLFTGALGVIGVEESDIVVGIRCCLITKNTIDLYVGSGIVKDSDAENEWLELDEKVKSYKAIFKQ